MAAITSTLLGTYLGAQASLALGAGAAGSFWGGAAALAGTALGGMAGYELGSELQDMLNPDIPDAPEPEPRIEKGSEGIRRGEKRRIIDKSSQRKLLATRGSRANDATLGGYMQTLGG